MSPLFEYIGTTYHFYEVARVLSNPSRHYGGVQWVFSPPVDSLPLFCHPGISDQGADPTMPAFHLRILAGEVRGQPELGAT